MVLIIQLVQTRYGMNFIKMLSTERHANFLLLEIITNLFFNKTFIAFGSYVSLSLTTPDMDGLIYDKVPQPEPKYVFSNLIGTDGSQLSFSNMYTFAGIITNLSAGIIGTPVMSVGGHATWQYVVIAAACAWVLIMAATGLFLVLRNRNRYQYDRMQ